MTVQHDTVHDTDHRYVALNSAYPRSWWTIAYSSDVGTKRPVPARILERDIVLWRDEQGAVRCMAAHCPHLGAHLGVGGEVVNGRVQCQFHGWQFDGTGSLCGKAGPNPYRRNVCNPVYRVIERYGALFLWNGDGEPDFEFPDILGYVGLDEDDVVFCDHRWLLPFPAKLFAENVADGMHFAFTHDVGGWGETRIREQSDTMECYEHLFYGARSAWSWKNVKRRIAQREFTGLLTPAASRLTVTTWGATVSLAELTSRSGILGKDLFCWTPVEEDSHILFEMALMPRIRIPAIGGNAQKMLNNALSWVNWTAVRQDLAVMMRRCEPAKPPYSADDRALIAYRRLWDSRIETDTPLDGDSVRHNGLRAGISRRSDVEKPSSEPSPDQLHTIESAL